MIDKERLAKMREGVALSTARGLLRLADRVAPVSILGNAKDKIDGHATALVVAVGVEEFEVGGALIRAGKELVRAYTPRGAVLADDLDEDDDL